MTKKLWIVRSIKEAYVVAESQEEALKEVNQIERWETAQEQAYLACNEQLKGWNEEADIALVYGEEHMTLSEARKKYA
jgi:hypothetical protein